AAVLDRRRAARVATPVPAERRARTRRPAARGRRARGRDPPDARLAEQLRDALAHAVRRALVLRRRAVHHRSVGVARTRRGPVPTPLRAALERRAVGPLLAR